MAGGKELSGGFPLECAEWSTTGRTEEVPSIWSRYPALSPRQEVSPAYSLARMQTVSCFPILCVPEDMAQSKMFIAEKTDNTI